MKKLFLVLFTFLFAACASYPPPQISNTRYTNFKYHCTIEIPEGWDIENETSEEISEMMGSSGEALLCLEYNKTNIILVSATSFSGNNSKLRVADNLSELLLIKYKQDKSNLFCLMDMKIVNLETYNIENKSPALVLNAHAEESHFDGVMFNQILLLLPHQKQNVYYSIPISDRKK